MSIFNVNV